MLSGLMHKPTSRLCLQEPGVGFPKKGMDRINFQMKPWGKTFRSKTAAIKWIKAHIRLWSAKEVRYASIQYMLRKQKPRKIIVLVRDIRHAAVSYRERLIRLYDGKVSADERFRQVTLPVANLLIRLCALPNARIVRYEDFCRNPSERASLADWLGFPLDGNLKCGFTTEQWANPAHGRLHEYRFHKGRITTKSVVRRQTLDVVGEQAHAEFAAHLAFKYQKFFGYSDAEAPMTRANDGA